LRRIQADIKCFYLAALLVLLEIIHIRGIGSILWRRFESDAQCKDYGYVTCGCEDASRRNLAKASKTPNFRPSLMGQGTAEAHSAIWRGRKQALFVAEALRPYGAIVFMVLCT
jgi:hypothetical protein